MTTVRVGNAGKIFTMVEHTNDQITLGDVQESVETTQRSLTAAPIILFAIVIAGYLMTNGAAHFPDWKSTYANIIQAYFYFIIIIILYIVYVLYRRGTLRKNTDEPLPFFRSLHETAPIFGISLLASGIVFWFIVSFRILPVSEQLPFGLFWPQVLLQFCVIATIEELLFRGVFLHWMHYTVFAVILQAVLFGLWHSVAYDLLWYNPESINWGSLGFAIGMGLLLGMIAMYPMGKTIGRGTRQIRYGVVATIPVHAMYNLSVNGTMPISDLTHVDPVWLILPGCLLLLILLVIGAGMYTHEATHS